MRIGIFGFATTDGTIEQVAADAAAAESQGFASYWAPQIFGLDALTALAVAGQRTSRIELGTAVVPTFPRHPFVLAQQAHTVNAASGGRFALGIGLSHRIVIESMLGLSFERPVRHLREYLSVLGPLSAGQAVSFAGELYQAHGSLTVNGSTPFPTLVAALGPQMLQVTAELADGTITWCTGPATLAAHTIPTILKAAEAAGRPAPRVVAALPVCVTADVEDAKQRAASIFAIYGQLPSYRAMLDREQVEGPADLAVAGSADEVVDRIGSLAEIGVTDFIAVEFAKPGDEAAATRAALRQLLG